MDTRHLYRFLSELEVNNNREWFLSHKTEWDDLRQQCIDDIDGLIVKMSAWEPRFSTLKAKDCMFRIYRDIRFKKDKSPYKTWICAAIGSIYGKKSYNGGYYIQIGPESGLSDCFSGLFGGVWHPETQVVNKLRKAIIDNIEEFTEIINEPLMLRHFPGWAGEKLKKLPRGYESYYEYSEFLRLKDFGKAMECNEKYFTGDWISRASEHLEILKPLVDFLNYSIEE